MKSIIKNGKIVDVINSKIYKSDILIEENRITKIGFIRDKNVPTFDATGFFLCPGLIDAHTHNEMTMLNPISFAETILPKGTTSVILDCHDLANVIGIKEALDYNIGEFEKTSLKVFHMLPINVPSSNETEICGNKNTHEDIIKLLDKKEVLGIAEVMDIRGVLNKEKNLLEILKIAKKKGLVIDGHASGLKGKELSEYIKISGVSTDHEFQTIEEAMERLNNGIKLILRKGILNGPNAYEIFKRAIDKSKLMLSTDGCTTVSNILEKGHMDFSLREIIREGIPPIESIKMATINVSEHYRLKNVGAILEGNIADILFISNLDKFKIEKVMVNGKFLEKNLNNSKEKKKQFVNTIKKKYLGKDKFYIKSQNKKERVNIIKLIECSLNTERDEAELKCMNSIVQANIKNDIIYASVINRYGKENIVNSFVNGFGLKKGALCCSNAQDSQNIIVIGTNHKDIQIATNELIKMRGGCIFVEGRKVLAKISLPIAGIMSDEPSRELKDKILNFENILKERGCSIKNPLFATSLMFTVSSIPKLKITDKGLYDVEEDCFKDTIITENFMTNLKRKLKESKEYLIKKEIGSPKTAIILGTGLSKSFLENLDKKREIDYEEIPHFYKTKIKSHKGKLICTKISGKEVILMTGRIHYYEGYNIQEVVYPIHLLKELGVENLFVTSSVGGVNKNLSKGDLILIKDHINFTSINPLIGYDNSLGNLFLNSSKIYNKNLINLAEKISNEINLDIKKGVMFFLPGPTIETFAELKAMNILGADTIGWSTIPEIIIAHYRGMKVLSINCITDSLNFEEDSSINDMIFVANDSSKKLYEIIKKFIEIELFQMQNNL